MRSEAKGYGERLANSTTYFNGEADTEVDLASQAYQIWKNATDANPRLKGIIEKLPNVVFSTRAHRGTRE